jgi:hypothetical protein
VKIQHIILSSLAIGGAATLLLPSRTEAWALLGFQLGTGQRDFRIFNNFTDASANNNNTPDANFPGHQGAVMAIWKACIEWNSALHGNGNGDPHQPGGLGSGGANFDAYFQQEATGVGGINDNIHSELSGSDGGVLAFTEAPDASGWRIRYYSGWTWDDGPNTNIGGNEDLQGVACHEYGHALGMAHTNVTSNATMWPSITGSGVQQRSIHSDDIAGLQSNYGVAQATKPRITGVVNGVGTLTITGVNFSSTNNSVWFTQANPGGSGSPVSVGGLSSTGGGTQIVVNVPATAGPGDVLVKINASGNASLSNSWPADPNALPPCDPPTTFCLTSPNSVGPGSLISWSGSQSVSANDFVLTTVGNPINALGRYFYGQNTTAPTVFGNGWRCINPFTRLPTLFTDGFGDGTYALDFTALIPPDVISPGETWGFQFWYRNPAGGGAMFNSSDGLLAPFCP